MHIKTSIVLSNLNTYICRVRIQSIIMKAKIPAIILLFLAIYNFSLGQTTFENSRFKFKATIPEDWRLHQEIKADSLSYTMVGWGLPKVYTEMDKHEVENAVAIAAIEHSKIQNLDDVIKAEFNRAKHISIILNQVKTDSVEHTSYITNSLMKNVSYVSKQYFIFKNGIGYIITFTATPGTFNINLPKFEEFYKTLVIQ